MDKMDKMPTNNLNVNDLPPPIYTPPPLPLCPLRPQPALNVPYLHHHVTYSASFSLGCPSQTQTVLRP